MPTNMSDRQDELARAGIVDRHFIFTVENAREVDEVIECFASALERSPEEISPNANFFLDLGGSSLDYFTLLGLLKDKYGISLPSDDKEKLFTVRDFCEFIKN